MDSKPKSARQLREEREVKLTNDKPDPLTMQTAKSWVGWESRKRARYCLMGEPD
jgi:hypothetical protein